MPPRYAYWTILVDDQPTAFRASAQEDLLPTLKRLQAKHPSAKMMWWQNGKLWDRRVDAQDAMFTRGELGRRNDSRQSGGGFRDRERKPFRDRGDGGKRSAWTPRGEPSALAPTRNADDKLDWKPKGTFVPAPKRAERPERSEGKPRSQDSRHSGKPEWRPKSQAPGPKSYGKPEWKPKGSFDREERSRSVDREERPSSFKRPAYKPSGDDTRSAKPAWKPKGTFDRERKPFRGDRPDWKSKPQAPRPRSGEKLEWTPKSQVPSPKTQDPGPKTPEKRKWVPKEEYKKSMGIEAKRDAKWRPGGLHKDPKQKYKDAKKAKWTRFKKAIRTRAESKGKKSEE
ncbi:MAG TPA: hypothetical protein VNT81_19150 [Vicinamibacterales bacterium]|nr:hypothetical protein [Vicinamibacterales bacterium]